MRHLLCCHSRRLGTRLSPPAAPRCKGLSSPPASARHRAGWSVRAHPCPPAKSATAACTARGLTPGHTRQISHLLSRMYRMLEPGLRVNNIQVSSMGNGTIKSTLCLNFGVFVSQRVTRGLRIHESPRLWRRSCRRPAPCAPGWRRGRASAMLGPRHSTRQDTRSASRCLSDLSYSLLPPASCPPASCPPASRLGGANTRNHCGIAVGRGRRRCSYVAQAIRRLQLGLRGSGLRVDAFNESADVGGALGHANHGCSCIHKAKALGVRGRCSGIPAMDNVKFNILHSLRRCLGGGASAARDHRALP